jgi:ubiquinone/menaquinone biosynthesis C-methylase UbiE
MYDKKYYDRGAGNILYDWVIKLFNWMNLNNFKSYFNKDSLILEVGCGEGKMSRWLSENGFKIEAIDISKEAIDIAKKQNSRVNYVCGNVFALKRENNYYNEVYSLHVMEHIENVEDSLKEIYRILKKEGKLVIRIPNSDSLEAKLAGKKWFHWDEPYHKHHWTCSEFKNILLKAGFKKVEINFKMLEYKQVLLYSCLNKSGIKTKSYEMKLFLLPFQIIFVPLSIILGFWFKNSGTVELVAEK